MPNKNYNARYNSFDGGDGVKEKGAGFKHDSNSKKKVKTSPAFRTHTHDRDFKGSGKGKGSEKSPWHSKPS